MPQPPRPVQTAHMLFNFTMTNNSECKAPDVLDSSTGNEHTEIPEKLLPAEDKVDACACQ